MLFENILVKKSKSKGSTNLDIQNGVLLNSISLLRQWQICLTRLCFEIYFSNHQVTWCHKPITIWTAKIFLHSTSEILSVVARFSEINLVTDSSVTEKSQTNRPWQYHVIRKDAKDPPEMITIKTTTKRRVLRSKIPNDGQVTWHINSLLKNFNNNYSNFNFCSEQ